MPKIENSNFQFSHAWFLDAGKVFDVAHSSLLQRANKTCQKILEMTGSNCEMKRTWRLNERHYGWVLWRHSSFLLRHFSGLTGSNKLEAVEKFGAEQVQIWRRSFATPPPTMEEGHEYFQTIQKVFRYLLLIHVVLKNNFRTPFTPMSTRSPPPSL